MNEMALRELDYGVAISVRAMIRAMGMQAENDQRKAVGNSMAYVSLIFWPSWTNVGYITTPSWTNAGYITTLS
jgi:hypothetical protein